MTIDFIKYHPDYCTEIADYMYKEWGHLRDNSSVDRYISAINNRLNTDRLPLTIIAIDNHKLIGFASIVDFDMDINRELTPWVSGVYVISEYRGFGIGKQLVNRLEQISNDLGFLRLHLFTFDKERFYLKQNWIKIKDERYLNNEVSVMTKDLKTKSNDYIG